MAAVKNSLYYPPAAGRPPPVPDAILLDPINTS